MKCSLMLLVMLAWTTVYASKKKIPGWHIRMAQRQGPNACAIEEVPDTNQKFYTECKYWMHRNVCGRKTLIRYECCEGFETVPGEHGCTGVKPLKDVLETAEDLGATIFVQYLKDAGLADHLRQAGAVTLFAPTNLAFEVISREQRQHLSNSFNNPRSQLLLSHLVNRRVHSKDFHADFLVDAMQPGNQLRLTKYSSGIMTVNCVPVVRKDQEANNGVVHLIDNVLEASAAKSVADTIIDDGRFEELSRMLRDEGLAERLRGLGSFTVLAPSDEEFTKIPGARRQKLRTMAGVGKEVAENHIIPHTVCLSAITDEHKLTTLGGNKLTFLCNETGMYVDGSRLLGESISGTNGVMHVVGDVIMPDKAKTLAELSTKYGVENFAQLLRKTGLEAQLDGYSDATIFAFSDEAFKELSIEEQERLNKDLQATREMMRFHIAQGRYFLDQVTDDQRIPSLDGRNSLRIRIYRKGFGVETAMMTKTNTECLNGVVHVIDKVLTPPTDDMIDLLQNDGNFSIIAEAIQKVKNLDPAILNATKWRGHSMTLFAPSDEAFLKLGKDRLRRLMSNTTYLTKIVKNHVVENMISSGSFKAQLHYNVQTKQNSIEVHKRSHAIRVGPAIVMRPDMVTREGIIHGVDRVLLPDDFDDFNEVAVNHG